MPPPVSALRVQVHPPGLGPVNVRVQVQGTAVTTALAVATGGAQSALLTQGHALRAALGTHGLHLAGLQVGVPGGGAHPGGGGRDGYAPQRQASSGSGPPPARAAPSPVPAPAGRWNPPGLRGRLDLVG